FFVLLVEAAVRYGIRGGLLMPLAIVPLLALAEWWRESRFDSPPGGYQLDHVVFPWGPLTLARLVVGWPGGPLPQNAGTPGGAGRGSRAAQGRARAPCRRARGGNPLCTRPQLVARPRRGFRGFHPRVARSRPLRPNGDRPRRSGNGAGAGRGRSRRRGGVLSRHPSARRAHIA